MVMDGVPKQQQSSSSRSHPLLSPEGEEEQETFFKNAKSPKPSIRPAWNFSPTPTAQSPNTKKRLAFSPSTTGSSMESPEETNFLIDPNKRGVGAASVEASTPAPLTFHQGSTKQFTSVPSQNPHHTVTSIDSPSPSLYRQQTGANGTNNNNEMTNTSTVDSTTFRKIRNRISSKYGNRMRKRVVFKNGYVVHELVDLISNLNLQIVTATYIKQIFRSDDVNTWLTSLSHWWIFRYIKVLNAIPVRAKAYALALNVKAFRTLHESIQKKSGNVRIVVIDCYDKLINLQWRWTFLIFTMSFLLSWSLFAMIYWLISLSHGDFEVENLPPNQESSGWSPCIANFHGYTSAFLYSLETQSTIGYGFRFTTEECPDAIFVMCVQTILGVIIQAVMVGVVFSKISRPKKRTQTLMFSKYAVICQRDGSLCLMVRVGDMRKSHIICASVRMQLIKRRSTVEGEVLPFYQHELKVGVDSDQQAIFFIWPMVVVHKIDRDSPLYTISAADLTREKFEIILILEGVIESTGATTQARTSYLPAEILWGHRFEPLVSFKKELGEYAVDYSLFNSFYEVDTPLCSAEELEELQEVEQDLKREGLNQLLTPFRVAVVDEKHKAERRASGVNNKTD